MHRVNALIDLLFTPIGATSLFIVLFLWFLGRKNDWVNWILLGLLMLTSSMMLYDDGEFRAPRFFFPIETVRAYGRQISFALLFLIVLITWTKKSSDKQLNLFPKALFGLIIIQFLILVKTVYYGNVTFAFIYFILFFILILTVIRNVGVRLLSKKDFNWAVGSIAIAGTLFVLINTYQGSLDMHSVIYLNDRFSGTSGNPNHAAVFLVGVIPAFLYFMRISGKIMWVFWLIILLLGFFWLYSTGSRTGFAMGLIAIGVFFWNKVFYFLRHILIIYAAAFFISSIFPGSLDFNRFIKFDNLMERYQAVQNMNTLDSREMVWNAQWREFNDHPIFGAPLQGSKDRIIFGESSWLGAASQFGWIGLLPMLFFGIVLLQKVFQLLRKSLANPDQAGMYNLPIAGILALLAGSFFEAYLLGNLSFPLICLTIYLILTDYLLYQEEEVSSTVAEEEPESVLLPGVTA